MTTVIVTADQVKHYDRQALRTGWQWATVRGDADQAVVFAVELGARDE